MKFDDGIFGLYSRLYENRRMARARSSVMAGRGFARGHAPRALRRDNRHRGSQASLE